MKTLGGLFSPNHACIALIATFLILWPCEISAREVEVRTLSEMREAFNDTTINLITIAVRSLNFTDEEFPEHAATIRGRSVILEGKDFGDGTMVYLDGNQLLNRVEVIDGGQLFQRNFWVDDCIAPIFPYSCFSATHGGGSRVEFRDAVFSDATCVRWAESSGITAMINAARFAKPLTMKTKEINEREILVLETGYVPFVPPTAYWRLFNVTLSCTGNVTHYLPYNKDVIVVNEWSSTEKGVIATVATIAFASLWWIYRIGYFSAPNEVRIARKKGFEIINELGSGRFGKVYRARHRASGRTVAVKVINLRPSDWRQLRFAWRECQLMSSLRSDSCVRVITYYSARVSTSAYSLSKLGTLSRFSGGGGSSGSSGGTNSSGGAGLDGSKRSTSSENSTRRFYDVTAALNDLAAKNLGITELQAAAEAVLTTHAAIRPSFASSPFPAAEQTQRPSASVEYEADLDGTATAPPLDSLVLQVHLVMEYADQGTLRESIKIGRFHNPNRTPNIPFIVETAVDIARGLRALHDPTHRMVHRDLSPNNVLLTSEVNSRGFRAILTDFGLSTVVALGVTHKTSEAKGTLAYMPPEMLDDNLVSSAVDIYSFGILLFYLLSGREAYDGMAPGRVVAYKSSSGDEQVEIPAKLLNSEDHVVQKLIVLIRNCTKYDRKQRPSAQEVVEILETLD